MPEKKEKLKPELENNDKTIKGARDQSSNPRREKFLDLYGGDGKSVKSTNPTTKTTS